MNLNNLKSLTRSLILKIPCSFVLVLTVQGLLSAVPSGITSHKQPNIIFIMSDDHTSQAVGVYGSRLSPLNPTPVIDGIAKEGMTFDNVFCTNSICTPSRACIITGQHNHINGSITLGGRIEKERQFLPLLLKKAGYQTAVVGKWHLIAKPDAFDYYNVLRGQGRYLNPLLYSNDNAVSIDSNPDNASTKAAMEKEYKGHSTDVITDISLNWLENKRDKEKPFFLMLHYKAPHDLFQSAPRYEDYLADVKIPEPASLYDDKNHGSIATKGADGELVRYIGTSIGGRNIRRNYTKTLLKLKGNPLDDETKSRAYQVYLKKYLRCVKGIDDNLARVIQYLRNNSLYDNTVIVYTGDQGMWLGEHDYQDKRWGYEESSRMPFIVRYPEMVRSSTRSDAIIENIDFAPTLLDIAGVETPDYMQGKSFKHILETGKEDKDWKKDAYFQYWMHMAHHDNPAHFQIRTKDYKLIFFYGRRAHPAPRAAREKMITPPGWELYDLKKDPYEMNNVYDDPAYSEIVKKLKNRLKEKREEILIDDPASAYNQNVADEIILVNEVVDEFWDYDEADRQKAIQISHEFLKNLQNN